MKKNLIVRNVVLCTVVLGFLACANNKPVPNVVSSANNVGYAESYHAELDALNSAYNERAKEARETMAEFPTYADELKEPDWNLATSVIERADEAGRSRDYAESSNDASRVRAFMVEGQDDINRRLSGTVKSEVEKSGCTQEVEVHGKLAYAHKDAVNKALEKQMENSSEANRLIDRNRDSLGKKNTKALTTQANNVSKTSYIVAVELPELWLEIDRLQAEEKDVRRTLEDELERELELSGNPDLSKAERKACDKRVATLEQALSGMDDSLQTARGNVSDEGTGINSIRKEYEEAIDNLLNTYREKAPK